MATQVNFCSQCGHSLGPDARFCASCGMDIAANSGGSGAGTVERSLEDQIEEYLRTSLAGEYDVAGLLGKGGMAIVYRAHELMLDREVAIKVLPPEMAFGSGMVERFKREAKTAAKLNHPNIIPIYRIGQLKSTVYFVMKYVPGSGLDDLLAASGRFDVALTAMILDQIGGALSYAHRSRIIHRDIKPSNIMVDEDGWAMVMDFGIAKAGGASTLTATGAAIGTPHYMSPEQCTGKDITVLSDQYSLAVMTYQMLSGALPFEGETLPEIISKHFFEEPTPLRDIVPDCPPEIAEAVSKALSKKPVDRFDSTDEFVKAIKAAADTNVEEARERLIDMVAGVGVPPDALPPSSPVPPGKALDDPELTTPLPVDRGTRPSAPTTPMPAPREPVAPPPGITEEPTTPMPADRIAESAAQTTPIPASVEPTEEEPVLGTASDPTVQQALDFPPRTGTGAGVKPQRKKRRGLFMGVGTVATAAAVTALFIVSGGADRFINSGVATSIDSPGGPDLVAAAAPAAVDSSTGDPGNQAVPGDPAVNDQPLAAAQPTQPQTPVEEPEPTPPPPPADGTVRVDGAPSGALVTVGGRRITDLRSTAIPPGRHSVVITADGYDTFRTTVTVRSGRRATVDASTMMPITRVVSATPPAEETPAPAEPSHPSCNLTPTIPENAGAVAALRILDCSPGMTVRVDNRPNDDGLITLRSGGRVRIILTASGFATSRVDTTLAAGATLVISGALTPRN